MCVHACVCVIAASSPQVFEDFATYMQSLSRLRELRPTVLYPGHGPVVEEGLDKINQYIDHRMARERQVPVCRSSLLSSQ